MLSFDVLITNNEKRLGKNMKKFLLMLLIATTLVGCNGDKVNNDSSNPAVTIVDNDETSDATEGNFGEIVVKQESKDIYVNDVTIDDSNFPELIARGFYLSVLDYKFDIQGKEKPSQTFIDYNLGSIVTPVNGRTYALEKHRVSFDDALTLKEGVSLVSTVEEDSMPVARYKYVVNRVIDLEVLISQVNSYNGKPSYAVTFTLTAVGADEYVTTTLISEGDIDINEAMYLSAFVNEPYKTLNLILDVIRDSYVTDTAYEEVLNFENRIDKNMLSVSESMNTISSEAYDIMFNPYIVSKEAIDVGRSVIDANMTSESLLKYEVMEKDMYQVIKSNEQEVIQMDLPLDETLTALADEFKLQFYCSFAKLTKDIEAEVRLYSDLKNDEKYIVASNGTNTYVAKYSQTKSEEILSIVFDLISRS